MPEFNLQPIGTPTSLTSNMIGNSFPSTINPAGGFDAGFNIAKMGLSSIGAAASSFNPMSMLASGLGSLISGGMNLIQQNRQWKKQEEWYNKYQSPQAQMQQMVAAGINPNLAAGGIAGNGAGQSMSPATPSETAGVSGEIGQLIGNSFNSAVDAANIQQMTAQSRAQTKVMEQEAKGVELDNAIKEVELGKKPELLDSEIQEKRAHAKQMAEDVENLRQAVKESKERVENLKKERDLIESEMGVNEYQKRLFAAEEALKKSETALNNMIKNGVNPNDPYYRYYQAVDKYGLHSPEAQKALTACENAANATARGNYNADPMHREFNNLSDAQVSLKNNIDIAINARTELYHKFMNNEISKDEYFKTDKELTNSISEMRNQLSLAVKAYDKASYKNGYHTWWQDNTTHIIDTAVDAVTRVAGAAVLSRNNVKVARIHGRNLH